MPRPPDPLGEWFASPLGRALLAREQAAVTQAVEQVFGQLFLQIGSWGPADLFLPHARTPRRALVAEPGARGDLVSHATDLPIASATVDAVFLPHTLEFEPEPHAALREAERVLVGEGHLIVLGFEPLGAWALRHRLSGGGFPPGLDHLLPEGRVRDWLQVLGFELQPTRSLLYSWPLARLEGTRLGAALERGGESLASLTGHTVRAPLAGAYLLKARKRVYTLTPVRKLRRRAPRLAPALIEPTSRQAHD
jgi:SAM-dependent methyltransferase